jgi:predicted nucleotidyltransferase
MDEENRTGPQLAAHIGQLLEGRSEIRFALLFGSQARGTPGQDSDIDLAVSAPGVNLLELSAELTLALGTEVDVIAIEKADIPMTRQIIDQSLLVHEGVRGSVAMWRSRALAQLEIDGPWYDRMSRAWINRVAERGLDG